ncbi:helix-turn-helix domain-containing protein [Jannaschia aquimarina]|uniref:PchR protein n=2 Tax=Jannaschia aquimarina TaxID=935700 RepID=A0A0D1EE13_9RHOB|nr:AraC family transcriptional regulator [Jannaschia aquimarina]KIT15161.1 Regulatory protein PchR [Jannaschia aquimarina]SNT43187.1 AraC-type DNA-binding protein [Jannaschia aquimarina]
MLDYYALHAVNGTGSATKYAAPVSRTCDLLGLTILAVPPGRVEIRVSNAPMTINVVPSSPGGTFHRHRIAGADMRNKLAATGGGGFDMFSTGPDYEISCENHGWELLLELDESRLHHLAGEAWNGVADLPSPHAGRTDPVTANLGRLAIQHLRFDTVDPLYVEGLAVALTARAVGFATGKGSSVSTAGTDGRVARAVEFIEANLHRSLSVAEIAQASCMSPSWLSDAFRASIGRSIWEHVKERRCERALDLISDPNRSLAAVAYECGFASQSHMTRLFQARFNTTPGRMRRGQ